MMHLSEVHPRTVRPTERSLELKIRMLKAEVLETMLYGCATWSPRACHFDTLRQAHHRFLTRCIGWRKHNRADHPISYLDTLIKTGSESIEAALRRKRIVFAGFVARMEIQDSLSVLCSENWWGARAVCVWGGGGGWGVSWTTSALSASTPTSRRLQPRTRGNGAERRDKGWDSLWLNGSLQRKSGLDYGMQSYAIIQSKRARAGSLALVD